MNSAKKRALQPSIGHEVLDRLGKLATTIDFFYNTPGTELHGE